MKHLKLMPAVMIVLLAMAMPSIAGAQYHEERLDHFLDQPSRTEGRSSREIPT